MVCQGPCDRLCAFVTRCIYNIHFCALEMQQKVFTNCSMTEMTGSGTRLCMSQQQASMFVRSSLDGYTCTIPLPAIDVIYVADTNALCTMTNALKVAIWVCRLDSEKEKFAHLHEASKQNARLKEQVLVMERQLEVHQQLSDQQVILIIYSTHTLIHSWLHSTVGKRQISLSKNLT